MSNTISQENGLYKLIQDRNKVNYGCIDEPILFNQEDYILRDFFGKEIKGWRRKCIEHRFNFIGIKTDTFILGIAAVYLGYAHNLFAYVFEFQNGLVYEFNKIGVLTGPLDFPTAPDAYQIQYQKGRVRFCIDKSHTNSLLRLDIKIKNQLTVAGTFKYGLDTHRPLRVLNPSAGNPHRFTFTEKAAPILPEHLDITLKGKTLPTSPQTTFALYDWSGGFFNRETNWYWAACAGKTADGTLIGFNFAALVNETFFPENAFWINHERTRIPRCIFDFDPLDPLHHPLHIWDEQGRVDLTFHPHGERKEMTHALIAKTAFRQFIGTYEGRLTPKNGPPVTLPNQMWGLAEIHRAVW